MSARLAGNLALSLSVTALAIAGLEGGARLLERRRPAPMVQADIWDWQQKWNGDFYTIRSDAVGWPPWEEFNADGVRDRTHAVEKPEGAWRLVFLGDSVTLGAGLAPEESYPRILQQRLDVEGLGIEVFNVSLWGWSTRQERIAYERIARKYHPDQVVLAVCLNDIPELQNNLTRPPRLLATLHGRSALVRLLVNAPGREIASVEQMFEAPDAAKVRAGLDRFFAEVRALRSAVRADGATLALLVLPFRFQVEPGAPPPRIQERIAAFCAKEEFRCQDLLPDLTPLGASAFLDYDHLSAAGARRVAEALRTGGLLPERASPAQVLAAAGLPPADLRPALHHPNPEVRAAALWTLGTGASKGTSVRASVAALGDPSERVRAEAARALGSAGEHAPDAIPALFDACADERASVRWEAARSLSRLELQPGEAISRLAALLPSRDPYVRGFAAFSLASFGPAAREAIPALVQALGEDEGFSRAGAATALARMGGAAAEAVPALLAGLRSADGDVRWKAARALGRIGPAARAAVPALILALRDGNEHVRAHAARALGRIGGPQAATALSEAARSGDDAVRREAVSALARLRED